MKTNLFIKPIALSLGLMLGTSAMADDLLQCKDKSFTLQTLGTGGPITDDQRASSGELIWINGKAAVLIDAGGGVYLRFGQSGARLEDVKFIGLSHFHTDHVTDLPAILKGAVFFNSKTNITLAGPKRGGVFPATSEFFHTLFNAKTGAFAYLNGLYKAIDGVNIATKVTDIDHTSTKPSLVYQDSEIKVTALGIPHGNVPCLAFRIESPKGSIVISADQNGTSSHFIDFAKDADILLMPVALDTHDESKESNFMHASPQKVANIANQVNPKVLVVNHFMGKSLKLKNDTVAEIKKTYKGQVYSSRDLSCYPISLAHLQMRK